MITESFRNQEIRSFVFKYKTKRWGDIFLDVKLNVHGVQSGVPCYPGRPGDESRDELSQPPADGSDESGLPSNAEPG